MATDKTGKEKDEAQTLAGSGQTSATEQLTSKIEVNKQYPGADVKKMVEDALSADGREQKDRAEAAEASLRLITGAHETLKTQFNTVAGQVTQLLKASDEAEVAKVGDDPVAISSLRARQANAAEALRLQGVGADYETKSTKLTERETEVNTKLTSANIKLTAMEAGVDEAELADLVPDGNPARLKKAADILKKRGPTSDQLRSGKPPGLGQRPASAISAGGGPGDLSTSEKVTRGIDALKKK